MDWSVVSSQLFTVSVLAQARAWLGWEMAVGFSRSRQLQTWDGKQWSQEDMPGAARRTPPAPRLAATNNVQDVGVQPPPPSAADASAPGTSPSSENGSHAQSPASTAAPAVPASASASASVPVTGGKTAESSPQTGDAANGVDPKKAGMPSMVAQALLECHYSVHGAFLNEAPLLEVHSSFRVEAYLTFNLMERFKSCLNPEVEIGISSLTPLLTVKCPLCHLNAEHSND